MPTASSETWVLRMCASIFTILVSSVRSICRQSPSARAWANWLKMRCFFSSLSSTPPGVEIASIDCTSKSCYCRGFAFLVRSFFMWISINTRKTDWRCWFWFYLTLCLTSPSNCKKNFFYLILGCGYAKRLSCREYQSKCPRVFKKFSETAVPLITQYSGKFSARGPHADRHEGDVSGVVILLQFESNEIVEKFYLSENYQVAKATRDQGCDTDLMIAEGM